jgi:serine protease inhibitor
MPALTRLLAAALLLLLLLAACGTAPGGPPGDAAGTEPDRARDGVVEPAPDPAALAASLSDADARLAAVGVNALGFALLRELAAAAPGENVVVSPLSAAVLLAMLRTGAGPDAEAAIAELLQLDGAGGETADTAFAALLYRLRDTDDVELAVANGLFVAPGYPLEPAFVERASRSFEATLEEADLGAQAGADRIDEWVDAQTRGLITTFADALGLPDPQAVLVLLNAVYFKGTWTTQFEPAHTRDGSFTLDGGGRVEVPLMRAEELPAGYRRDDRGTVGRLPYGDAGRYGMEILLPAVGTPLHDTVAALDATAWGDATRDLPEIPLPVTLPRFEVAWASQLDTALRALGMGPAYQADYLPMSPANPELATIAQKTFVRVDEEGTQAAAVTGGMQVTSAQPDPLELRVDRPFLFAITDAETGTILFLGAIHDPTA